MRRHSALTIALYALLGTCLPAATPASSPPTVCLMRPLAATEGNLCPPRLEFQMTAGFAPRRLPPKTAAPVGVRIKAESSYADGTQPPPLKEVAMDFDRNAEIDVRGLPICRRPAAEQQVGIARHQCRDSIVGDGIAHVAIEGSENSSISIPLTVFNGGLNKGVTTLFVQSYFQLTPLVVAVHFQPIEQGRFGLEASAKIPPIANGTGSILDFSITTKRRIEYAGARYSYARARCPDRHLAAKMEGVFSDGGRYTGAVVRACQPKQRSG
jgi:hypothetical protein